MSGSVPVKAMLRAHAWPSAPCSPGGRFGAPFHFLVFPEPPELGARLWLPSVWLLKAQAGLSTSLVSPPVLVPVVLRCSRHLAPWFVNSDLKAGFGPGQGPFPVSHPLALFADGGGLRLPEKTDVTLGW